MTRPYGTKKIETPEALLAMHEDYVKKTKGNPILVHDYVGKDGISVRREKERPITMDGFYCYCYELGHKGIRHYFDNENGKYGDYAEVAKHIKLKARVDQIDGGMVGIYNNSITARLNGLVDKSEVVTKEMPLFPDVQTNDSNK